MDIIPKQWQFFNNLEKTGRNPNGHFNLYCSRKEYDGYIIVSSNVLKKMKFEPEVVGFSVKPTFIRPYNMYVTAINADNIDNLLKKYTIEGIFWSKDDKTPIMRFSKLDK